MDPGPRAGAAASDRIDTPCSHGPPRSREAGPSSRSPSAGAPDRGPPPRSRAVPRVIRSTVLDAPADEVWAVIRDFNGHDRWHPAVDESHVERGEPSDRVGCVRAFRLASGDRLRERLLTLSDMEQTFAYCLLDTTIPLFNYVAHVRLLPVTDGDRTFWEWESRFDAPKGRGAELARTVGEDVYAAGFDAIRRHMGLAAEEPA